MTAPKHGMTAYRNGCRCTYCVAVYNAYQRSYLPTYRNRKAKEKPVLSGGDGGQS